MSTDSPIHDESRLFTNPWPTLITGLAALMGALLLSTFHAAALEPVVVALLGTGLIAAAVAVVISSRNPMVLLLASFAALLGCATVQSAKWDKSALLPLGVLAGIAALAALLMLLPRVVRRVVVSLLILAHFGGILTAVLAAPPSSWIAQSLWTHVYRPYLQFMYLNNAYHFYSPEPGPATMLWFFVEYEKDAKGLKHCTWVKLPDYDDQTGLPLASPYVQYTRRLSLVEYATHPGSASVNIELAAQKRRLAGQIKGIPMGPMEPGPMVEPNDVVPPAMQYYEPDMYGKVFLSSYVRHVAATTPCAEDPSLRVTGVKIYRVVHRMLLPGELAAGRDPYDPTTYRPYYFGEYDADGNMKPYMERDPRTGDPRPGEDPFLHWMIPIVKIPVHQGGGENAPNFLAPTHYKVVDYVPIHAGDPTAEKP